MTTRKSGRCRCPALAVSVCAVLAGTGMAGASIAAPGPPAAHALGQSAATGVTGLSLVQEPRVEDAGATTDQELYLEVSVNRATTGRLARFVIRDGALYASAATLRELGLRWSGSADSSGLVALAELPGVQAEYDAATQRIALLVPVAMLDRETERVGFVQPDRPRVDPATRAPGVIFNYDLYGQRAEHYGTLSGFSELRVFGLGPGVWSNTLSTRFNAGDAATVERARSVRLDTYWQLDLPDTMVSLTVGDSITGALDWSRATRIGGVRLARNFALQPYRITTPLASFAGEAVLPSTVDLYIDGLRQSTQDVQPGRFQIDSVPSLNGAGQAQLVITDINGQSRVVGFSMYGSPELLQAGLSDWSLDLGVTRREYGLRSFEYGDDPLFSATGRYGLTDRITLEGHAEGSRGIAQAGIGGVMRLGERGGVVNASLAGSRGNDLAGHQYGLGYQWNSRVLSVSLNTLRRSAEFRDVASLLEGADLPRRTDQAFIGVSTSLGQWGMSYITQDYPVVGLSRYASLNWSRSLPGNSLLSLSVNRDLENDTGSSAFLYWSMPLDRMTSVSASLRHTDTADSMTLEANRAVPSDLGGWGWRAQATVGDTRSGQAQVSQLGRYGQWTAGVDHQRGTGDIDSSTVAYASANGGLVWMQGHTYAMRRVDDAFALVDTSGIPGVPVRLENRVVGQTDDNGLLLINRLNAWQRNQLSIDPMDLPADMQLGSTQMEAVPESRSGMLARFAMRRSLSVQLAVKSVEGQWLPVGSTAWMESADGNRVATTIVGHDGMVYLQDPPEGARLRVRHKGKECMAPLPALPAREGRLDLGELKCQ